MSRNGFVSLKYLGHIVSFNVKSFSLFFPSFSFSPILSFSLLLLDISAVHLGGKMVHESLVENDEIAKAESKSLDVKAAIEASYGVANVGASYGQSSESSGKDASGVKVSSSQSFVFGGAAPAADLRSPGAFGAVSESSNALS